MSILYIVVAVITIGANAFESVANFARAKFVVENMTEVRVPGSLLPVLATAKAAGALGLAAGLLGMREVGIAAAAGLTVFYVLAVATHVKERVFWNIGFPIGFLILAAGTLALAITH
ncbi:DoxX family protein [Nocardia yamanashiensis]|uniref:DoxX family protein n=1 Tax=Nocardia yamanashiensis TaxID=209247 RepID=UPI001E36C172|nr:DoxX family protein [Nocardia yamanashiensis]UGT39039.1 DoxX family protein [Nocardia yamanashiensis]